MKGPKAADGDFDLGTPKSSAGRMRDMKQLPTAGSNQERSDAMLLRARESQLHRIEKQREAIIDRIHELMAAENMSRADLARRLGKTRGYITQLLSGEPKNFTIDSLVKLGEVFGQDLCLDFRPRTNEPLSPEPRPAVAARGDASQPTPLAVVRARRKRPAARAGVARHFTHA